MDPNAAELLSELEKELGGIKPAFTVRQRSDGPFLVLEVANPSEPYHSALLRAQDAVSEDNPFSTRATIVKRQALPRDRLSMPECRYFRRTISESLTVDRYSFKEDFFQRYIRSVTKVEDQIVGNGNFIVYGRRGSGKSILLAYAMRVLSRQSLPYAWIAMQAYAGRRDTAVTLDIITEILTQLASSTETRAIDWSVLKALNELLSRDDDVIADQLVRIAPRVRRLLRDIVEARGEITVFLDDLHLVDPIFQPLLLNDLYRIVRGNRCYLKLSAIEQFAKPWDAAKNIGMQLGHDLQSVKLDYNLTTPDRSRDHIESILSAHAQFAGLPSIRTLAGSEVLARLTWAAAAVPRDALRLFALAMEKAETKKQLKVSVTSVNAAASEAADEKLRDIEQDTVEDLSAARTTLEEIKRFCIKEKGVNAFLVEIVNEHPTFRHIQQLIALRLVHVLSEGITPHEAGRRHMALLLDYGFYVGVRAARRVTLFLKDPKTPTAKELRNLPVFALRR